MCLVGVVVRRYIDFLILLIPTPLVSAFFVLYAVFSPKNRTIFAETNFTVRISENDFYIIV